MQNTQERLLIEETLNGNLDAFGELIKRYQNSVFNVCYRMLGNKQDAEDLTQETFIKSYKKMKSFDTSRPFGPWIRKIAVNLCLNVFQGKKYDYIPFEDSYIQIGTRNGVPPEKIISNFEQIELLHQAILELPHKHKAVIELRHYQEFSYQEISDTLNIPLSDVKSYLFRARKILAERLDTYVFAKK